MAQLTPNQEKDMQNLRAVPFCMTIRLKIIMEFLQNLNFRAKDTMERTDLLARSLKVSR